MLKLVKASLVVLAGLGMASVQAQSGPSGFRLSLEGNRATGVVLQDIGQAINARSMDLAFPGFQYPDGQTRPTVSVRDAAPIPGTNQKLPVTVKAGLSVQAIAKGFARATAAVALWETGSALYDIWGDFGLSFSNGQVSSSGGSAIVSTGSIWRTNGYPNAPFVYGSTASQACNAAAAQRSNAYPGKTFTGEPWQFNSQCLLKVVERDSPFQSAPEDGTSVLTQQSCASGWYVTPSGCSQTSPIQVLTQQEIEDAVSDIVSREGWPSRSALALRDAVKIPEVQDVIRDDAVHRPPVLKISPTPGIELDSATVGDPVESSTTTTNADGSTSTATTTTTTTATANGNRIDYTQQRTTTTTTRDAAGVVTGTTTSTTTAPQTPNTPSSDGEDLECGLPGGPPCKIDEEGTPDPPDPDEEGWRSIFAPIQECAQDLEACLPELPEINLTFAFPSSCGAIPTPAFAPFISSINICQYQGMFHDLMSMIWAAVGVFGAISIVSRNPFS